MTNLLIDIGNTNIKWGVSDQSGFRFLGVEKRSEDCLRKIIQPAYENIRVSNVADPELESLFAGYSRVKFAHTEKICTSGLINGYRSPEQLGVDRWLAMKAAWHESATACIVIGCGTAITIDQVDATGQHLGGLIFPGLHMMRNALSRETNALPSVTGNDISSGRLLANNTVDAIAQGTVLGIKALLEMQMNTEQGVFLTGGDAGLVARLLNQAVNVDAHLVLKGLAID